MERDGLQTRLQQFGRRLLLVGLASGVGWGVAGAILFLLGSVWLDLLWELSPSARVTCLCLAGAVAVFFVGLASWRGGRAKEVHALGRRLDQVAGAKGEILSGIDLSLEATPASPLSAGLATIAIRRADRLVASLPRAQAVPARPALWSFGGVAMLAAAVGLAAVAMPRLAVTEWILTVPRLEEVRFRIHPPAYTGQPTYEGPLPQGGLSGLPGTRVEVRARSNRPLATGTLEFPGDDNSPTISLLPDDAERNEVKGAFEIRRAGKIHLTVTDTDEQVSADAFTAPVLLLNDERPFVRLLEPRPVSYATPDSALPVTISAEDDYGVARVQLFRSLNDSRALPFEVSVPVPPKRQWTETLALPLKTYGLAPGDEVKLFGRVEDNDPAGAKGSESPIVVVRIISHEDFERLVHTRQGIESSLNKYRQARRRLEGLASDADRLRKKARQKPSDNADKEMRADAKKLAQQIRAESEALLQTARKLTRYDLDKHLRRHLEASAQRLKRLADKHEALAARERLTSEELAKALDDMMKELGQEGRNLEREAIEPVEQVASVMPLLQDESRFVILVQLQRALADRLKSLKGTDRPEDLAVRTRMRDLQTEQQEIRAALDKLLDDIEEHLEKLPNDADLEELRKSATEFVQAVRKSGATQAMQEAEAGLGAVSGTRGHAGAEKAAEILEKLLARCKGQRSMGALARAGLRFKPGLSEGLGDTLEQLLADAGLLPGGDGSGPGGGTSSRRSTLDNVGLYGSDPEQGEESLGDQRGGASGRMTGAARGGSGSAISGNPATPAASDATGASGAAIPLRYRRRVADYFQRIVEETGKK